MHRVDKRLGLIQCPAINGHDSVLGQAVEFQERPHVVSDERLRALCDLDRADLVARFAARAATGHAFDEEGFGVAWGVGTSAFALLADCAASDARRKREAFFSRSPMVAACGNSTRSEYFCS